MPKTLRDKLAARAKELGLRMPQVQLLLAQERFLARVATADTKQRLIWKGGSLVLRKYTAIAKPRFTSDIDFLARGIELDDAETLLLEARNLDLNDGFRFLKVTKSGMERNTPYGGYRYEIAWEIQKKPQSEPLRLDLCAGDDVDPANIQLKEIYLLEDESDELTLSIYPVEFIFAEKLETLARFGTGNTRLKDFIDLWNFTQLEANRFSKTKCESAIRRCFSRRKTNLDPKKWQDVLLDAEFQEIMEAARERNFSGLPIPSVATIFQDLFDYLRRLKFT